MAAAAAAAAAVAAAAVETAWMAYQATKPYVAPTAVRKTKQPRAHDPPRALTKAEQNLVAKAIRESTWDEGVLEAFVGSAGVQGKTYKTGPHKVLFFAKERDAEKGAEITEMCRSLWDWLGVKKPFTLVLWWREDPRYIAPNAWPSRRTINGGWTMQNSNTIYVYRAEEWDRVFLHEMIHALGWDWHMPRQAPTCWGLPTHAKMHPAFFEAWTELFAEWLWCCWHATDITAWWEQRQWQDEQAVQILARQRLLLGGRWEEDTSIFAYYVLKAALAPHIASLLRLDPRDAPAVLCSHAVPGLAALRRRADRVQHLYALSLRMTKVE